MTTHPCKTAAAALAAGRLLASPAAPAPPAQHASHARPAVTRTAVDAHGVSAQDSLEVLGFDRTLADPK